jgi:hypothetical protein
MNRWRGRPSTAVAVLVLVLVSATVLGACGGGDDGPRLSEATFTKRANAQCAVLEDASNELRKAQDPSATGDAVTKFVKLGASRLRDFVDALDALPPPADLEDDLDTVVDTLNSYADGLEALGEKTANGQSFRGVQEANPKAIKRLNSLSAKANALVAKLGLVGCLPS